MAGIGQLFQALALIIPVPVLVAAGVVGVLFGLPAWLESVRLRQIRGLVRRLVRAEAEERDRLERQIETLCATKVHRWTALVEAAHHYGRAKLRDHAVLRLEALGAHEVVRRWRQAETRPVRSRDPLEALVRIEGLYRSGLTVAADEELAAAMRQFPNDPDLKALHAEREAPGVTPSP